MPNLPISSDGLPPGIPSDHGVPSLGYENLWWAEEMLAQPDGERAGDPWRWTRTQARVLLWMYALDESGQFLHRRAQIVLPKGGGKSPLGAAIVCCEFAGPVIFNGFDDQGEPMGRPHPSPHVQCTAVELSQTYNTYSLAVSMMRDGQLSRELFGFDPGLTRTLSALGRLEPVSASSTSREGQRITFAVLDETHLWLLNNGGTRLAATLRRNLAKTGGRSIETTNAWMPGEDSVAEQTATYADKLIEKGKGAGLLRYHPIAKVQKLGDRAEVRDALNDLYRDSPWVNVDRLVEEIYDLGTHPGDARRYYLNQVVAAEDSLIASYEWDACLTSEKLKEGDDLVLGFDGGRRDDATALVAERIKDRLAVPIHIEEKPLGPLGEDWEVNREAFDGAVDWVFGHFKVRGFYADVSLWETYVDRWAEKYRDRLKVKASPKSAVGWDMRGRQAQSTAANERLVAAIQDGEILNDGDLVLRRHVLNARRRPNRWGVYFGKEHRESPKKVDGYSALLLADMARYDLLATGWKPRDTKVTVWR